MMLKEEVVKGFYKGKLLLWIMIVLLLLSICVTVDYADNNTIENINGTVKQTNTTNVTVLNGTQYVKGNSDDSYFVAKNSDKIHIVKEKSKEKSKIPVISMWAKPSVRSRYSYTWYRFKFIDYCPNCHHYHCLLKNPKCVPEREYTCKYCDSDYCAVTGKEKYSWSHYYLRRA